MSSTPLSIVVVIMIVFVYFVFVSVSSCLDHRPYTHLVGGKVSYPCSSFVCAFNIVFACPLLLFGNPQSACIVYLAGCKVGGKAS